MLSAHFYHGHDLEDWKRLIVGINNNRFPKSFIASEILSNIWFCAGSINKKPHVQVSIIDFPFNKIEKKKTPFYIKPQPIS